MRQDHGLDVKTEELPTWELFRFSILIRFNLYSSDPAPANPGKSVQGFDCAAAGGELGDIGLCDVHFRRNLNLSQAGGPETVPDGFGDELFNGRLKIGRSWWSGLVILTFSFLHA